MDGTIVADVDGAKIQKSMVKSSFRTRKKGIEVGFAVGMRQLPENQHTNLNPPVCKTRHGSDQRSPAMGFRSPLRTRGDHATLRYRNVKVEKDPLTVLPAKFLRTIRTFG